MNLINMNINSVIGAITKGFIMFLRLLIPRYMAEQKITQANLRTWLRSFTIVELR